MDIFELVAIVSSSSLMGLGKVLPTYAMGDVAADDSEHDADPGGALTSWVRAVAASIRWSSPELSGLPRR